MLPPGEKATFYVCAGSVCTPGMQKARSIMRRTVASPRFSAGHLVVMRGDVQRSYRGRYVFVVSVHDVVDISAVSGALDGDPAFATAVPFRGNVLSSWHAVRVHHRCRAMAAAESSCERWGSQMHILFQSMRNCSPATMVDRLRLRAAGVQCVGGDRDEALIAEVSRVLSISLGKDPFRKRPRPDANISMEARSRAKMQGDATTIRDFLLDSDTSDDDCSFTVTPQLLPHLRREQHEVHNPSTLDDGSRQALLQQLRGQQLNAVQAFSQNRRTESANTATSSRRNLLDKWIASAAGRAWKEGRKALWHPPE